MFVLQAPGTESGQWLTTPTNGGLILKGQKTDYPKMSKTCVEKMLKRKKKSSNVQSV